MFFSFARVFLVGSGNIYIDAALFPQDVGGWKLILLCVPTSLYCFLISLMRANTYGYLKREELLFDAAFRKKTNVAHPGESSSESDEDSHALVDWRNDDVVSRGSLEDLAEIVVGESSDAENFKHRVSGED